jgi:hypothetical protein
MAQAWRKSQRVRVQVGIVANFQIGISRRNRRLTEFHDEARSSSKIESTAIWQLNPGKMAAYTG